MPTTSSPPPPLGLPTEYYTFKICQVPVGHPVLSNIKFHENPSSWTRVVACEQSDGGMDRQTYRHDEADIRFRNFANAPKKAQRSGVAPQRHTTTQRQALQLNSVPILGSDETELRSIGTRSIDIRLSSFH